MLISVGAEFKRALFVGQTKYNQTFRPTFESNNVIIFGEDGSPAGTRILAPMPRQGSPKARRLQLAIFR